MICRYKVFYLFLLAVPFFNILGLKFGNAIVQAFILSFFSFTLLLFRQQHIRSVWLAPFFLIFGLVACLLLSELHSLINLGQSNINSIRFFGMFIPVLLFYILSYNPRVFVEKYWDKLLRFYILVFSLSIMIDFYILHSALDISLQPMYREEDWSYFTRPFGITGQPSVNSVLLVFFYTLLLSRGSFNENKLFFLFMVIGVLLQGSGSGFIALLILLNVMFMSFNWFIRIFVYSCGLLLVVQLVLQLELFEKISVEYISGITNVFISQTDDWVILVKKSEPIISVLLGGVSSGIDFGPLYFMSNVGLIYLIIFLIFIVMSALKAKERYEKSAFLILLIGNLHYPVMFYAVTTFILPLLLQKNIFPVKDKTKFSRVGIP
ncbi:MAG: hypothetical protein CMA31_01335 [Euryarchaeota archaeon]|nr:hypothetical protein [Euryarchaeota archaeon]